MKARIPLYSMAEQRKSGNDHLFLASDGASCITGAVMGADGRIVTGTRSLEPIVKMYESG